jgi:hypothetical protein
MQVYKCTSMRERARDRQRDRVEAGEGNSTEELAHKVILFVHKI